VALEVAESLGHGVAVRRANPLGQAGVRKAVEEGVGFGCREGQVEARDPLGVTEPPAGQHLALRRDAGEDRAQMCRRHLALEAEETGALAHPVAGGLTRAGVVLLAPDDDAQVVVL